MNMEEIPSYIECFKVNDFSPIDLLFFWDELKLFNILNLKYSPFGVGTIEIPPFHKQNYLEVASSALTSQFQHFYPTGAEILLKSISKNIGQIYHREIKPEENIIIFDGANPTTAAIIDTHCNYQDEVLIFEPFYNNHLAILNRNKDLTIRLCPFDIIKKENQPDEFKFNLECFTQSMRESVKVVLLINPNNPTGYVFSKSDLEDISSVLKKYPNTIVIEDNSYFAYLINPSCPLAYFSSIDDNFNKSYNVFSGGKLFNAHGMRIGWAISSKERIDELLNIKIKNYNIPSSIEQLVCSKSLDDIYLPYKNYTNYFEYLVEENKKRISYLSKIFEKYNIVPLITKGSYYLVVDVKPIKNKIPDKYFYHLKTGEKSSELDKAFCRWLLEYEIGCIPLSASSYNSWKYSSYVRISTNRNETDFKYLQDKLEEMLIN